MRLRIALSVALLIAGSVPSLPAFAETRDEATADCEARLGLGPGSCKCFMDDWAGYSEDTRAFIAAMANNDKAKVAEIQARISQQDLSRASFFIATISSKFSC